MRVAFANNGKHIMKPTTFVITLIFALLIGWGLLKCNRQSEADKSAPVPVATAPVTTAPATTTTTSTAPAGVTATSPIETPKPSVAAGGKKKCCCKSDRTERFEPNTASAPDHRPLF
jgi:hypothetical protein